MLLLLFNTLLLIPFLFWVSHLAEVSVSLVTSQRAHFKNSVARTRKSEARKTIKCCVCITAQVLGTLPLFVNPASLAGGATASTLPLHGLQVQTVTPQLLLNAQGQIIATVGNGQASVVTSAAVLPKANAPATLTKPSTQVCRMTLVTLVEDLHLVSYRLNI